MMNEIQPAQPPAQQAAAEDVMHDQVVIPAVDAPFAALERSITNLHELIGRALAQRAQVAKLDVATLLLKYAEINSLAELVGVDWDESSIAGDTPTLPGLIKMTTLLNWTISVDNPYMPDAMKADEDVEKVRNSLQYLSAVESMQALMENVKMWKTPLGNRAQGQVNDLAARTRVDHGDMSTVRKDLSRDAREVMKTVNSLTEFVVQTSQLRSTLETKYPKVKLAEMEWIGTARQMLITKNLEEVEPKGMAYHDLEQAVNALRFTEAGKALIQVPNMSMSGQAVNGFDTHVEASFSTNLKTWFGFVELFESDGYYEEMRSKLLEDLKKPPELATGVVSVISIIARHVEVIDKGVFRLLQHRRDKHFQSITYGNDADIYNPAAVMKRILSNYEFPSEMDSKIDSLIVHACEKTVSYFSPPMDSMYVGGAYAADRERTPGWHAFHEQGVKRFTKSTYDAGMLKRLFGPILAFLEANKPIDGKERYHIVSQAKDYASGRNRANPNLRITNVQVDDENAIDEVSWMLNACGISEEQEKALEDAGVMEILTNAIAQQRECYGCGATDHRMYECPTKQELCNKALEAVKDYHDSLKTQSEQAKSAIVESIARKLGMNTSRGGMNVYARRSPGPSSNSTRPNSGFQRR
jgi:hypothetical protein